MTCITEKSPLPPNLVEFKGVFDRLSVVQVNTNEHSGPLVLLDGRRIVVPKHARKFILERLHASHSGILKTLTLANKEYYWPFLRNSISQFVKNCEVCQAQLDNRQVEKLLPVPISSTWSHGSLDLADLDKNTWLIFVDRLSGFPLAHRLASTTSAAVIKVLLHWFTDFGFPKHLRADNGPQFRSAEFRAFCREYGITLETSSPYNPRGNGLAENAVKQVKRLLKKAKHGGNDFRKALLEWRNVPQADGLSPAMLVFGRAQKTELPRMPDAYNHIDVNDATTTRLRSQQAAATQANSSLSTPQAFQLGDNVLTKTGQDKVWKLRGQVVGMSHSGRSLLVEDDQGFQGRINRRHCRLLPSVN